MSVIVLWECSGVLILLETKGVLSCHKIFTWEGCIRILVSMGNHWQMILCKMWLIIDVLNLAGNYWCAQWESILGVPWEINGVCIVVGMNNMGLNAP